MYKLRISTLTDNSNDTSLHTGTIDEILYKNDTKKKNRKRFWVVDYYNITPRRNIVTSLGADMASHPGKRGKMYGVARMRLSYLLLRQWEFTQVLLSKTSMFVCKLVENWPKVIIGRGSTVKGSGYIRPCREFIKRDGYHNKDTYTPQNSP